MEIKVGDYVKWVGETMIAGTTIDGIFISKTMVKEYQESNKPKKVEKVGVYTRDKRGIALNLKGMSKMYLYPVSQLAVVPQFKRGDIVLVKDWGSRTWEKRIFLAEIDNAVYPYVVVPPSNEENYKTGKPFLTNVHKEIKAIPDKEHEDVVKRLAEAEETIQQCKEILKNYESDIS